MILHTALQFQLQNIHQTLNSQKTPHSSPSRASYGVSFVRIWEKIDRFITTPHRIGVSVIHVIYLPVTLCCDVHHVNHGVLSAHRLSNTAQVTHRASFADRHIPPIAMIKITNRSALNSQAKFHVPGNLWNVCYIILETCVTFLLSNITSKCIFLPRIRCILINIACVGSSMYSTAIAFQLPTVSCRLHRLSKLRTQETMIFNLSIGVFLSLRNK